MVKKTSKPKTNTAGAWVFLIGVILAVVIGLFNSQFGATTNKAILGILVVLGIAIGLLNITTKESSKFLLVSLALVIVSYMGQGILIIIPQIGGILSALLVLFVPTTIIVALRSLFVIARD